MLFRFEWVRTILARVYFSPAGKTFLISLCCWLLTFAYCKGRYWRDPHSAFFNSDHVYELKYSALRESQATTFTDIASLPSTTLKKALPNPEVCAALITVKREGRNYMVSAIGSMLEGLAEEERSKLFAYVLFANVDPSTHPSWNETWLRKAVDLYESYEVDLKTLDHLKELEDKHVFQEKGIFDYVYAIEACYRTEAPYIIVFEDDIILADGWLAKTRSALHTIRTQSASKYTWGNWIYLRLFYTETYIQWGQEDFWYRYMALTFLLGASAGWMCLLGLRRLLPSYQKLLDLYTIALICIVIIPAFTALVFMIGKASLLVPHGVFELNKWGCCTQGLVFPRSEIPGLISFLREKHTGQTDFIIEEYAESTGKMRLALYPQVLQHVGLRSSRGSSEEVAQSTWAFFFEELNAVSLRKEHEKLLASGPWER